MLFVPAAKWSMLEKAAASDADVVCIDLEDSVQAEKKESSRANVVRALRELDFGRKARMCRINGLATPYAYRDVIEASPNQQVTIRTLDIGGDKTVPYLGHTHQEANPFMGRRSIRLSFEHPEFFSTQLRAILRAATDSRESPDQ